MFGTSGIRGRVGSEVTADLALAVGRALGADTERVVVGRDPRESGDLLVDSLAAGLREVGTDVVDLGVAATPTIARAVGWVDGDAGVAVTASHNPAPDNGLKLWEPGGKAFGPARRDAIADRVAERDQDLNEWNRLGCRTDGTVTERHLVALEETVSIEGEPRVIVDLGNGAGLVTVRALDRLGCRVTALNAQPDGTFPGRPSEPTADHCTALTTLVSETDAALGIAHDGDADRTRVVTADGTFLSGDVTLAILAAAASGPGDRVAVPIDTSLAVADFLADRDVGVTYTPVGDVHVAESATAPDVVFGGEPSGAWIWPAETLCPDGPLAACHLVALDTERPLGERAAAVPPYPIHRDSVTVDDSDGVMERVSAAVTETYDDVDERDGVRVDLGDAWFLIRASGTQPLVRITAEARDADRAGAVFEEARAVVEKSR